MNCLDSISYAWIDLKSVISAPLVYQFTTTTDVAEPYIDWYNENPPTDDESVTCVLVRRDAVLSGYRPKRCTDRVDYICEYEGKT